MPDAARVASGSGEMAWTRMPLGPQFGGEVAHRGFQRRLGDAHDVVILHHDLAAVIVGHREQRVAHAHQRLGEMRHADESPARHVHGGEEAVKKVIDLHPQADGTPCVIGNCQAG
jgi:hypothetical protein